MILNRNGKIKGAAFLLAGILSCSAVLSVSVQAEQNPKEEIVYVNLSNDGKPEDIYVVNYIQMKETEFFDFGEYSEIRNLTTTDTLVNEKGKISGTVNEEQIYYQGRLEKQEIPWEINITYWLDGRQTTADQLAGQSGKLEIEMTFEQNMSMQKVWRESFALQVTAALDTNLCTNMEAPEATIANVGQDKQFSYIILPGQNAEYKIQADVKAFEMEQITINAIPLSLNIDDPDLSDTRNQLVELQDGIAELDSGAGEIAGGADEIENAMQNLKNGTNQLSDGSALFYNSLALLNNNAQPLSDGMNAFGAGITNLASALGGEQLTAFAELEQNTKALADGAHSYLNGLDQMISAYQQQLAAMPEGTDTAGIERMLGVLQELRKSYEPLYAGTAALADGTKGSEVLVSELNSGVEALIGSYAQLTEGIHAYMSGTQALYNGYGELHDGIQKLNGGSAELSSGSAQLTDAAALMSSGTKELREQTAGMDTLLDERITELLEQYTGREVICESFADAKNTNITAVQFVMKTEGIHIPEETEDEVSEEEDQETFWSKFKALFF